MWRVFRGRVRVTAGGDTAFFRIGILNPLIRFRVAFSSVLVSLDSFIYAKSFKSLNSLSFGPSILTQMSTTNSRYCLYAEDGNPLR
jgi:hypothetical protein